MPRNNRRRLVGSLLGSSLLLLACSDGSDSERRHASAAEPAPLVIDEQGSFFVGGEVLNRGPDDDVTINQMYVQYQIPDGELRVPVVMIHGCCLSSATWETTPDGRMGWSEYFVRKGHPVYLAEQSGRARSGFDATVYNQVANGEIPPNRQPQIFHASHQWAWDAFRFGAAYGVPFEDGQFPIEALDTAWKQVIPDMNATLPDDNPTWSNLANLAGQLGGAVLVGHSQSGTFPLEAALRNPEAAAGLVLIEPGQCYRYGLTEEQLETLAEIPVLFVFGDHLADSFDGRWQLLFDSCVALMERINDAGGDAEMLYPPELGISGNSHMLMQDRNSLEIADLVMDWMEKH